MAQEEDRSFRHVFVQDRHEHITGPFHFVDFRMGPDRIQFFLYPVRHGIDTGLIG